MPSSLNTLSKPLQWSLLRKGTRIFALLGKATPFGLTCFSPRDLGTSWALTAEFGCLRLERLSGDEEVTGDQVFLPTPFSYDYGLTGANDSPALTRAVFGLLASELEELVKVLRRGSFPVLGFARGDLRCCISSATIPGYWPHVVISNLALHGNVLSLETFVRVLVSSLPQGHLAVRYPSLQPILKHLMRLTVSSRRGIPYTKEMLELAPAHALAVK